LRISYTFLKSAYRSGSLHDVPLPVEYSNDPRLTWDVLFDEREPEEIVVASLFAKDYALGLLARMANRQEYERLRRSATERALWIDIRLGCRDRSENRN
jgi:hypothetical protein